MHMSLQLGDKRPTRALCSCSQVPASWTLSTLEIASTYIECSLIDMSRVLSIHVSCRQESLALARCSCPQMLANWRVNLRQAWMMQIQFEQWKVMEASGRPDDVVKVLKLVLGITWPIL